MLKGEINDNMLNSAPKTKSKGGSVEELWGKFEQRRWSRSDKMADENVKFSIYNMIGVHPVHSLQYIWRNGAELKI